MTEFTPQQLIASTNIIVDGTDTYTAAVENYPGYITGSSITLIFTNANTGAATLNINSWGAKGIKKTGNLNLSAGDIANGQVIILTYDGTNFQIPNTIAGGGVAASFPTGAITQFAGASAPADWLLCDGAAVSRTTYDTLFALISTTYGVGDGSTTFNLPNLKGRVPVGFDASQTEFDNLAETGGTKTHTLDEGEIPAHTHIQDAHNHAVTDAGHTHLTQRYPTATGGSSGFTIDTSMSGTLADNTLPTKTATTGVTVNNATPTNQDAGGGGAHNNLQPYITLNYIIKT